MTDLDALKEDLAALRERGDLAGALTATTAELYRLIEEVERLRGERAAVVAWLDAREEALNAEAEVAQTEGLRTWAVTRASEAAYAALVIERGEHRREEEK